MSEDPTTLCEEGFEVRSLAVNYRAGARIDPHAHEWPQLVYAARGVITVEVDDGAWIVPPHRAVWVPAEAVHSIVMTGQVAMRTLYFSPTLIERLPRACQTIEVSPLLRELILHITRIGALDRRRPDQARLAAVLLDLLAAAQEVRLDLPSPRDPRAQRFADMVTRNPADAGSNAALARKAGASLRTIERFFLAETGVAVGEWRRRVRLFHALHLLEAGGSVTEVALEVGYDSTSAFCQAFRRQFGHSPKRRH